MQSRQQTRPLLFYNQQHSPPSNINLSSDQIQHYQPDTYCFQENFSTINKKDQRLPSPMMQTSDISEIQSSQQSQQSIPHQYEVFMRCVTWSRDSHGLFDYESKQIAKRNIKTYTGGKIIRLNNDVEFISKHTSASDFGPNAKPLIIVNEKNGRYFVENDTLINFNNPEEQNQIQDEDVNNKMFLVVRNLKSSQAKNKGDIIKLGRIKFKVKDFRTDTIQSNLELNDRKSCSPIKTLIKNAQTIQNEEDYWIGGNDNSEEAIEIDCGVVDSTQNEIQCKVCWSNEQSSQNPLLNSCKCDGSVRYIHYECLKYWLKQKMQKKEDGNVISYSWKQFECEICKKPYPYVFRSNGRKYRLVDVQVPEDKNFIWLESLTFEKNSSRMVHLVIPDESKNEFKLGRGHESDVRISDISVSRTHAILKLSEDNQFYLEDNLSKFGTLVLAKSIIELDLNQTQAIQIGRSVISFTVKPVITQQEQKSSMQEILRQKIEETNLRISKLMNQAMINCNVQIMSNDNEQNFQMYLQKSESNSEQEQIQSQNDDIYIDEKQLNQQEKITLNNTLQRFEQIIQNVERLQKESNNGLINHINTQINSQSPVRINQIKPDQCRIAKNTNNEWRFQQLLNELQNPEQEQFQSFVSNTNTLSKSKYGRQTHYDHNKLKEDEKKEEFNNSFSLYQKEFQYDEDIPLRIQQEQKYNKKIDLSQYIQLPANETNQQHFNDYSNIGQSSKYNHQINETNNIFNSTQKQSLNSGNMHQYSKSPSKYNQQMKGMNEDQTISSRGLVFNEIQKRSKQTYQDLNRVQKFSNKRTSSQSPWEYQDYISSQPCYQQQSIQIQEIQSQKPFQHQMTERLKLNTISNTNEKRHYTKSSLIKQQQAIESPNRQQKQSKLDTSLGRTQTTSYAQNFTNNKRKSTIQQTKQQMRF